MLIIGILFLAILLIFSTTIFTKVKYFINFGTNATLKEQARRVADAGMLEEGEEVGITGFGVFLAKKRAARMGVNPRTGEKVQIAATTTPKFRAGKSLKDAVK